MTGASGSRQSWRGCLVALLALGALAACEASPAKTKKTARVERKALGGQPLFMGSLSREEIEGVIRANLEQIAQCHQQELRPCPALASKVVVRFVIGDDGDVTLAEIKKTTLADPKVENCMLKKIRRAIEFARVR